MFTAAKAAWEQRGSVTYPMNQLCALNRTAAQKAGLVEFLTSL